MVNFNKNYIWFMFKRLVQLFKNKYFIAIVFTLVWLLFFDRYDFISQRRLYSQLKDLRNEKKYYSNEIDKNVVALNSLLTDSLNLEKFAREKYYMKKDNEDIFVIICDTLINETRTE